MNCFRKRPTRSRLCRNLAIVHIHMGGLLAAWASAGCHDPRISIQSFLQLQQKMRTQAIERAERELTPKIDPLIKPYTVGSSDVLSVTVTGSDRSEIYQAIKVRVDRNGEIKLPLLGAINVEKLELEDVEDKIQHAYVPAVFKDAVVHVETEHEDTVDVLVVGAAMVPGLVHLRRNERNMLYAIVGAGGLSQLASGRATLRRVLRPTETVTLDLEDPVQLRTALTLDPLGDGDLIDVQAATPNTIFVGGLVDVPGPQMYPPGTEVTVLQALAAAHGLRTDISPKEGTLIRRLPDGRDVHVKLDFTRIMRAEDPNITLAAGDILWAPHTLATRIEEFINRNIFFRAGISATYSATGIEFINRRNLQSAQFSRGTESTFDPLGFLSRNAALQTILTQPR